MSVKKIYHYLRKQYYRVLTRISPELNVRAKYWALHGKKLNLKNPKSFADKLLYLKLVEYNKSPKVAMCADKVAVRTYVEAKGFGSLLNEVIGIYQNVDKIPWENLPNQFVLKWNFGASYNIICDDKSKLDFDSTKRKLKKWGKSKYWLDNAEMQYKKCEKQLICERYLDTKQGFLPYDYKIYCFNGIPKAILFIMDRDKNKKGGFFSTDWKYMAPANSTYSGFDMMPEPPISLKDMLECAAALAEEFPFVRVDFYQYGNKAIFGEMTFTPAAGMYPSECEVNGVSMGELLKI